MAFDKVIPSKIAEYKIFDVNSTEELVKVASDIDFPDGFNYDPDFLYLWVRIVSAGEFYGPNKNGDYFPEDELLSYWETFNEAHPFKDHKNKEIENAIGKIITVRWNSVMKCVELLKAIDKNRAPEIARGYLKGYLTDVSMGCKVPYTVCSVCGNKARKRSEFCVHVRHHRLQFLGNGERVYEINYKPKFHDSSTVLNGAERVAKAFFIVDAPPANFIASKFKKTASVDGTTHYVKLSEYEMEKVAEVQKGVHPLLQEETVDKIASKSVMMTKIAELEKELTGKLLNIVSAPKNEEVPAMKQMLQVIKFLTEERLSEESLENIAVSVKRVAKQNDVPVSRAFTTLIGVAELMGIEFFPHELHMLLRKLSDADLNPDLSISDETEEMNPIFPSEFAEGIDKAVSDLSEVDGLNDPSSLLELYNESAHRTNEFSENPNHFISIIGDGDELDSSPKGNVVRIIRATLNPLMSQRSSLPDHLYPRLSVVLSGHKPIIGGADVRRELVTLAEPKTSGDKLARLAYKLYENMRPNLFGARLIKLAFEEMDGIEKSAFVPVQNDRPKKGGINRWKLALGAIPAAYAASAFQKNRREHGRFLGDGENFVADHPGIVAGGAIVAGKPLSRAVGNVATKGQKAFKTNFVKEAEYEFIEGLTKIADSIPSGQFNVFDDKEVMKRYIAQTGATGEQSSALKMATLFSVGGMEKEANEITDYYNIPQAEIGRLLKIASEYMDGEIEKAAEDFTNNLILSTFADSNPLARTLPGRAADAYILKKLFGNREQSRNALTEVAEGAAGHQLNKVKGGNFHGKSL